MQYEARKTSWSQIGPKEQFLIESNKENSCFGSPNFYRKLESNLSILENRLKTKGKAQNPRVLRAKTSKRLKKPGISREKTSKSLKKPGISRAKTSKSLKKPSISQAKTSKSLKKPGNFTSQNEQKA